MGHFGVDLEPAARRARDELREAVREPAGWRRAAGCPRRGRSPSTSASPATRWPRRTPQLVAEGWLVARQGSGTWVAERAEAGGGRAALASASRPAVRFDLRPGVPDLGAFPRAAWLAAARRALAVAPDAALGYGDPRGRAGAPRAARRLPRARPAGAGAAVRRSSCAPASARPCGCCAPCCVARGARTVAVEAFGHRLHRDLIAASGLARDLDRCRRPRRGGGRARRRRSC